jgi:tyrosyl-tRNA synthetase
VSTFLPVAEQMDLLLKGIEACEKKEELEKKLTRSLKTGRPLRVKVGFDPSAPDLHLGHTVVFRKMRHFQELGHEVVFLIGDFTGMIGDPTGKKATRPQLTKDEILANAETYKAQVFKILDPVRTRVMFNSEWLSALGAEGLVRLCAKYTVAQLLERDDFAKRFKEQKPIAVHELLYPLCQGYDSVALDADVELGGTDQLFNLLVGRELMRSWDKEPQCVLTLPLLVGTDGVEKMSKSLNNAIGVTEPPNEIFGKVMSVSDAAMWAYWTLLTDRRPAEIEEMRAAVAAGTLHPKKLKMDLGLQIVSDFHGQAAAFTAQDEFERRFAGAGGAVNAEEILLSRSEPADGSLPHGPADFFEGQLADVLVRAGLAPSKNVARQKVKEGAVSTSADGQTWTKADTPGDVLKIGPEGLFLRLGKKFVKVRP